MSKKSVTVQLRGGLGNQLFQYGAGFALSRKLGTELLIDCGLLPRTKTSQGVVYTWPEQVSSFSHSGSFCRQNSSKATHWIHARQAQMERHIGDFFPQLGYALRIYAHERIDPVEPLTGSPHPVKINAYCNSRDFFASVEDELKSEIRSLSRQSSWYTESSERIKASKPLAIHLRLGDYKNLENIYGRLDSSYFERSMAIAMQLSDSRNVLVFSDEPALAAEFFRNTSLDVEVVIAPEDSSPLESLLLISQCAGLIASNSSFSWWAGYLMEDRSNPVIFPRPLFHTEARREPKRWLLDHWLQLGNPQ
jgi:hypothetical protein